MSWSGWYGRWLSVLLELAFEVGVFLKVYIFLSGYSSSSRLETMSSNYRVVPRSFRYITGQM
jgi:hypothetical protein